MEKFYSQAGMSDLYSNTGYDYSPNGYDYGTGIYADSGMNGNGNGNSNSNGNSNGNGNGNSNGCRGNITNTATAQGYYIPQAGAEPVVVTGQDSVKLGCIFADIAKTADRQTVNTGDTIKYTVTFRNMSDREMYNVKITDNLSPYLNVIATTINPAPQPGESLEGGITIGRVPAGSSRTLTFSTRVTADAAEDIVNRAFADFTFRDDDGRQQTASTHITSVTTTLERRSLTVHKTADRQYITANGDEVVFTITVNNPTGRVLGDVVVTDSLPEGLVYVENSTSINGDNPIDSDPAGGIYIGAMDSGSEATVKFTAKVQL